VPHEGDCPNLQRAPQLYVFVVGSSRVAVAGHLFAHDGAH
jgi:hypothetical protein